MFPILPPGCHSLYIGWSDLVVADFNRVPFLNHGSAKIVVWEIPRYLMLKIYPFAAGDRIYIHLLTCSQHDNNLFELNLSTKFPVNRPLYWAASVSSKYGHLQGTMGILFLGLSTSLLLHIREHQDLRTVNSLKRQRRQGCTNQLIISSRYANFWARVRCL